MKIAFFDVTDEEQALFGSLISKQELSFSHESLTRNSITLAKHADVVYVRSFSQITKDILSNLPRLRFIATRSTGFDNIDIEACQRRKIVVSNVPHYATVTVAEHTLGLLLSLTHNIVDSSQQTKKGSFKEGPLSSEISNKTLGIVVFGAIGSQVATIARGFDMRILVYTTHPTSSKAKKYGVTFVDFQDLLQKCDAISFHVPLTQETHHMLNMNNIALCKRRSILLNTSRGEVIETKSILWALDNGVLVAAGLDVLENERELKQSNHDCLERRLMKDKRVIVTPHNAYHSHEALETILRISAENINAFIRNKPIHRVV